ncbi:hypothetical protein MYSI104531_26370 [Mycobacterium simiae]
MRWEPEHVSHRLGQFKLSVAAEVFHRGIVVFDV